VTGLSQAAILFAESNTRFIVEVAPSDESAFSEAFAGLPCVKIGAVSEGNRLTVRGRDDRPLIDASLAELKAAWQRPLNWD
jgi:phosphoribosylformylglycinamidine synthase